MNSKAFSQSDLQEMEQMKLTTKRLNFKRMQGKHHKSRFSSSQTDECFYHHRLNQFLQNIDDL